MLSDFFSEDTDLETLFRDITHELKRGTTDKKHAFRYVVFITAGREDVSGRYVVLRKLTDNFEFIIYTDKRTAKVTELLINEAAALLFYDQKKKLQIRINGNVHLHNKDEVTVSIWKNMPEYARKEYQSEMSPGSDFQDLKLLRGFTAGDKDDNFCVLRFIPNKFDVLQLHKSGHQRARFILKDEKWIGKRITP